MATVLQDALYDCDWLPFEAFESDAAIDGKAVKLHRERYQVLIVPPTEVITHATLAKAKAFFESGGVVVGYGRLPSKSGTVGTPSADIVKLRNEIWGGDAKISSEACKTSPAGGKSYFLPEKPDVAMITAALHKDAGISPVIECVKGETDNWVHALHRVKDERDIFLICNQHHEGEARSFVFRVHAEGEPEAWDAMRNEITSVPYKRIDDSTVDVSLTLEPTESVLLVFQNDSRALPARLASDAKPVREPIAVVRDPTRPELIVPSSPKDETATAKNCQELINCAWIWYPEGNPVKAAPPGKRYFRGSFSIPEGREVKRAFFEGTADNSFTLYVNGEKVGGSDEWKIVKNIDIGNLIEKGENVLAIAAVNTEDKLNPAGLIGRYEIQFEDGTSLNGCLDSAWKAAKEEQAGWNDNGFDDDAWEKVQVLGNYGCAPWGNFADEARRGDLTESPVRSDPFSGHCELPSDVDLDRYRVYLVTDKPTPEAAANVTVNGQFAGGFIGAPFRIEVSNLLKLGRNDFKILPFAPENVRLLMYER
ncbi:MAG: glycosyl hydrolase [Opitutales bacterium]